MAGRACDAAEMGTASGMVDDPMNRTEAPVAKLMTVFETVIADPGTMVEPSTTTAVPGLAVMTAAPTDSVRGGTDDSAADAWVLISGCTVFFDGVGGCATGAEVLVLTCGSGVLEAVGEACDDSFELSALEGTACAFGVFEGVGTCTLGVLDETTACALGVVEGRRTCTLVESTTCALGVLDEGDGRAFSKVDCGENVVLWP